MKKFNNLKIYIKNIKYVLLIKKIINIFKINLLNNKIFLYNLKNIFKLEGGIF